MNADIFMTIMLTSISIVCFCFIAAMFFISYLLFTSTLFDNDEQENE